MKVIIHFNETELIKLNALTKESGRFRKSYLRSLINGIDPCNKPSKEHLEILSELRHIGTKMNQIVHIAHKSSYIDFKEYSDNVNLFLWISQRYALMPLKGSRFIKKNSNVGKRQYKNVEMIR